MDEIGRPVSPSMVAQYSPPPLALPHSVLGPTGGPGPYSSPIIHPPPMNADLGSPVRPDFWPVFVDGPAPTRSALPGPLYIGPPGSTRLPHQSPLEGERVPYGPYQGSMPPMVSNHPTSLSSLATSAEQCTDAFTRPRLYANLPCPASHGTSLRPRPSSRLVGEPVECLCASLAHYPAPSVRQSAYRYAASVRFVSADIDTKDTGTRGSTVRARTSSIADGTQDRRLQGGEWGIQSGLRLGRAEEISGRPRHSRGGVSSSPYGGRSQPPEFSRRH